MKDPRYKAAYEALNEEFALIERLIESDPSPTEWDALMCGYPPER